MESLVFKTFKKNRRRLEILFFIFFCSYFLNSFSKANASGFSPHRELSFEGSFLEIHRYVKSYEREFSEFLEKIIPESLLQSLDRKLLFFKEKGEAGERYEESFKPIDFKDCESSSHLLSNLMYVREGTPMESEEKLVSFVISPHLYKVIQEGYRPHKKSCRHKTQYEYVISVFIYLIGSLVDHHENSLFYKGVAREEPVI